VADTIGSLVDKLVTTNIKLWFTQDIVHQAAKTGEGVDGSVVQRLHSLNIQRNQLMTEVDMLLAEAVQSGEADVDPRHKLY
jgi:hypothetical protein